MKFVLLLSLCMGTVILGRAQYVYTIKADSVKLTNSCDSTELILLNHTQGVNGFLYNPGTGRTYFQRGLLKLSDSTYLIGADTLKVIPFGNAVLLNPSSPQNGNVSVIGTVSVQGMIDATNNINISNGGFLYVGGSYLTPQLVSAPGTFTDSLWVGPSYGASSPAFEVHSSGIATYSSDYGSLFTPRTLVDKGYVDSSVQAVKPTLATVLTNGNTASTSIIMPNTIPILYTNVQGTSKVDSFYLDNTNHFRAGNSALTWDSAGNVFVKDTLTTGAVGLELPNGGSIFSRETNGLIRSLISYDNANVFHIAKGPEFDNGFLLNGTATLTTDSSFTIGTSNNSLSNLYVKPPAWNGSDAITILAKDNTIGTEGMVTVPLSNFASASGSANYIQNQNATQQTGNFYINGAANSSVQITSAGTSSGGITHHFFESSGTQRWGMGLSGAESGSNTGSNLYLARTADNGSALDFPFTITRSTGLVTLADGLTSAGTTTLTGLSTGFVQSSAAGVLSSAALTSTQVTTALGFTPLSSSTGVASFNGSTGAVTYNPTLATVTTNGATTTNAISVGAVTSSGAGTYSGNVYFGSGGGIYAGTNTNNGLTANVTAGTVGIIVNAVNALSFSNSGTATFNDVLNAANGLVTTGTNQFNALGAGFVQSSSSGVLSSAALTSGQVTTALGFTPLSSTYSPTLTTVLTNGATTALTPTFQAPVYALNTGKSVAHGATVGYAVQDSSYSRFWMSPSVGIFLIGGNGITPPTTAPIEIGANGANTLRFPYLSTGFLQSDASGDISSAALTSTQVTTALGYTPLSSTTGVTSFNGSVGAVTYSPSLQTVLNNGSSATTSPVINIPYGYGMEIKGTTAGTTNNAYYMAVNDVGNWAGFGITSSTWSNDWRKPGDTYVSSTIGLDLILGSAGYNINFGNPTTNFANFNGITGNLNLADNLVLGTAYTTASTSPAILNEGASYGTNAVGSYANAKLRVYDNGSAYMGFGASASNFEFNNVASSNYTFYSAGTQIAQLTAAGALTMSSNLGIGTGNTGATTTPSYITLGPSYGSNTPGAYGNAKLKLYDEGTSYFGFGISNNNLEFNTSSTGNYTFYNAGTQTAQLSTAGVFTTKGNAPASDSTYTNGTSSASWSQIYVKPPSWNGTDVVSILGQDYTTRGLVTIPQTSLGKNFIQNQFATQQIASFNILDTVTNSTTGGISAELTHTFNWTNPSLSLSGGSLFNTTYTNSIENISLPTGSNEGIGTSIVLTSNFNRLTVTSATTGYDTLTIAPPIANTPGVLAGTSTQVYFPNIPFSAYTTVSGVAAEVIKSAYTDSRTLRTVRATNYYQLLIEPSDGLLGDTTTTNNYAIYQAGDSDLNYFNGAIEYKNKYSASGTPTTAASTGAGTSPSVYISGTTDGGVLTVTTGTSPTASATVVTLTFSNFEFPTGCSVILYPANKNAAALTGGQAVYVTGSRTGWTLNSGTTGLSTDVAYVWNYQVSGY